MKIVLSALVMAMVSVLLWVSLCIWRLGTYGVLKPSRRALIEWTALLLLVRIWALDLGKENK